MSRYTEGICNLLGHRLREETRYDTVIKSKCKRCKQYFATYIDGGIPLPWDGDFRRLAIRYGKGEEYSYIEQSLDIDTSEL